MIERAGIERGEHAGDGDEVAEGGDAAGLVHGPRKLCGDEVAATDESVSEVEDPLVVRCLEEVPTDEKGFGVLAWSAGETALKILMRVGALRFELKRVCHGFLECVLYGVVVRIWTSLSSGFVPGTQ